jgi:hypothetical protein
MRQLLIVLFIMAGLQANLKTTAQIPNTKKGIDQFIDSLGQSSDRSSITSKIFPAMANPSNFKWMLKMVYNKNNELLWVEEKIPDSVDIAYIYCKDKLIFVSHFSYTYTLDSASNRQRPIFRKVYFVYDEVVSDSAPSTEPYTSKFFLEKSREHLAHFKTKDQ